MPFRIIRNDITKVSADAIVNTANPRPAVGTGTDSAIYEAAGRDQLLEARAQIGNIEPGSARHTPAFGLDARYIIHTVGPAWRGGTQGEYETLASCYRQSLRLAADLGCASVAFPLISTGVYGFPKAKALDIALAEISAFCETSEMDVTLVVFDKSSFELSADLTDEVAQYIDENYVGAKQAAEYRGADRRSRVFTDSGMGGAPADMVPGAGGAPMMNQSGAPNAGAPMMNQSGAPNAGAPKASGAPRASELSPETGRRRKGNLFESLRRRTKEAPDEAPSEARQLPEAAELPKMKYLSEMEDLAEVEELAEVTELSVMSDADFAMASEDFVFDETASEDFAVDADEEKFAARELYRTIQPGSDAATSLEEALRGLGLTFQQQLLRIIDSKGVEDPEVYKRANIDRKLFSKIRCNVNYKPSKSTVLALAISLGLNLDETTDLLRRAGLALSPSDLSDVLVQYCITHGIHDIYEVNALLFKYDQQTL